MSNLSILISLPVAILGFLFLFWRRLKDDYSSKQIFSFSFLVLGFLLLGFFIGNLITSYSNLNTSIFTTHGLWFWLGVIFGSFGFIVANFKFKMRFFETLESAGLGFLFWFFTVTLISSIQTVDLKVLALSLAGGSLIVLFFFLDSRYKSFVWYKSGKLGFSGLSVLGIFFLVRSLVALLSPNMLSFVGKIDAIADLILSFAFFITLFKLSDI